MAGERSEIGQGGRERRGNLKYYPVAVKLERGAVVVAGRVIVVSPAVFIVGEVVKYGGRMYGHKYP